MCIRDRLYDLYQGLLTEKQKKYFEDYYFDNLSLGEMSDAYDVSRNAIFKQIQDVYKRQLHHVLKIFTIIFLLSKNIIVKLL